MLYRDFAPTPLDPKGAFLDDRQDWIVLPVSRTRDSEALEQSNFEAALDILKDAYGEDSELFECHQFNHWGPGWFEIILAHPSLAEKVQEIEERLKNYPVLDEEDFSRREYEATCELITEVGKRFLNGKEPEDWVSEIFGAIADPNPDHVDENEVKEALFNHGWLDDSEFYTVTKDGEPVYEFMDKQEAIGRAECLWNKSLWQVPVSVSIGGEVVYNGGDLPDGPTVEKQNPAPMQEE